ncbi:hypothetical protein MTR_5g059000 [Medicago truncatula]|uniref:Uncharacterized protein n=1 Tax=Medicago truncatula TaxID=3880 RepID=G7K8V6_MEDTR|nr:hypothetical protein MTR_5g059000 [Medicago truncatula]
MSMMLVVSRHFEELTPVRVLETLPIDVLRRTRGLPNESPTSNKTWPDNVFISGGNTHLTSRFCGVVLDPTTIFKMVSEPPPRSIGPPAIRFPLSGHPPFMSTNQAQ